MNRCAWPGTDPLYVAYHDLEWGVPVHDDRTLFEFITLDGAQAGLSWITILRKRDNYRRAFDNFDIPTVAAYSLQKIEALLQDAGIVRNRRKIETTVTNAQAVLRVQQEFGSLDAYLWSFVGGRTIDNRRRSLGETPSKTAESDAMSKDMIRRGFKFCGSTICYAFMQAAGLVNDHVVDCFRYAELVETQNLASLLRQQTD
jgi:DNA-3-methyladenine glycosylase I